MRRSKRQDIVVLGAAGLITLGVCAVPYTPAFREWQVAREPVAGLLQEVPQHPNDAILLYYAGRHLNDVGRYSDAEPLLERAMAADMDSARIRDERVRALLGTGQVSRAYGELRQFVGTHDNNADAHLILAKYHITQQNPGAAQGELERVIALDTRNAEAWSLVANVRLKQNQHQAGEAALDTALRLDPNRAGDHLQHAVLLSQKEPRQAEAEFRKAMQLAPKEAIYRRELANFLLAQGRSEAAIVPAHGAVALDEHDPLSQIVLGKVLLQQKQLPNARLALEAAYRLSPQEPVIAQELRKVYDAQKNHAEALRWQQRYVVLQERSARKRSLRRDLLRRPNDKDLNQRYANLMVEEGDGDTALRSLARALRVPMDSPQALTATATALLKAHKTSEALPLARRAAMITERNPAANEVLGDVLLAIGRTHEAAAAYNRAVQFWPQKNTAYHAKLAEAIAMQASSPAPARRLYQQALRMTRQNGRATDIAATTLLQQSLALAPEDTATLRLLMQIQFRQGLAQEAQQTTEHLLSLSPEDGIAHAHAALLLLGSLAPDLPAPNQLPMETLSAAETHLRAAEQDAGSLAWVGWARGVFALRRGEIPTALRLLRETVAKHSPAPQPYRELAQAEERAGNKTAAQNALQTYQKEIRVGETVVARSGDRPISPKR